MPILGSLVWTEISHSKFGAYVPETKAFTEKHKSFRLYKQTLLFYTEILPWSQV